MNGATIQIGVDLGGSNLHAAAFGDGATPFEITKEAVGDDRAPDAIVERVARTVERLAGDSTDPIAVGVGVSMTSGSGSLRRSRRITLSTACAETPRSASPNAQSSRSIRDSSRPRAFINSRSTAISRYGYHLDPKVYLIDRLPIDVWQRWYDTPSSAAPLNALARARA